MDSSEEAIETIISNVKFNMQLSSEYNNDSNDIIARDDNFTNTIHTQTSFRKVNVVKADVNQFLKQLHDANSDAESDQQCLFDVVICDPPKLAPKKTFLKKAMKK